MFNLFNSLTTQFVGIVQLAMTDPPSSVSYPALTIKSFAF